MRGHRGDEKAREALEWILRQQLPPAERMTWAWEAVWFHAFSLGDAAAAREMQRVSQELTPAVLSGSQSIEVWKCAAEIGGLRGSDGRCARSGLESSFLRRVRKELCGRAGESSRRGPGGADRRASCGCGELTNRRRIEIRRARTARQFKRVQNQALSKLPLDATISPDGKTFTLVSKGTDAQGRPFESVEIQERQ